MPYGQFHHRVKIVRWILKPLAQRGGKRLQQVDRIHVSYAQP
jgi:hypothetical protein